MIETVFELLLKLNIYLSSKRATKKQGISHIQVHSHHKWTNKSRDKSPSMLGQNWWYAKSGFVNGPVVASKGPLAIKISHNNHVTAAWMEGWIGLTSQLINRFVPRTLTNNQQRIPQHGHILDAQNRLCLQCICQDWNTYYSSVRKSVCFCHLWQGLIWGKTSLFLVALYSLPTRDSIVLPGQKCIQCW